MKKFMRSLGDLLNYNGYWINLAIDAQTRAEYYDFLSPDECDRAARLLNLQHQNDFIAARDRKSVV